MAARTWPTALQPSRVAFEMDVPDKSGGLTLTGDEQIVQSTAGRWKSRLTFAVSRRAGADPAARLLAARGIKAYMQGRGRAVLVGPYDRGNSPGVLAGGSSTTATAGAGASLGATTISINMSGGLIPRAGQYFGLGGARLYLIEDGGVGSPSGSVYPVTFWPPLRAALSNGASIDFTTPVCQMRMAAADSFGLDLSQGYVGEGTIELVEDFRP